MSTKRNLKLFTNTDISDQLDYAIQSALGVQLAIMGQGNLSGFDSSPIAQLVDFHVEHLEKISHSVAQLRAAS